MHTGWFRQAYPGVGPVTAHSFRTAIDDPSRYR